MKKIALVLAGCGHQDGAEITETVSLLIALSSSGADVTCFAPNISFEEVDHQTKSKTGRTRNVLVESGRITRGLTKDLSLLQSKDFDGLCFAGGSGVAKNLCTWASEQAKCEVLPKIKELILEFYEQSKPIGAVCIAPVLLAKVLGKKGVTITIGNDESVIAEVRKTGAQHETCPVDDYLTDRECKVVTTPAYMYDNAKPHEVFKGISGLAQELVEWA